MRCLRRRGVPDAGALHGADADAGRQLGPRLAAGLAARTEPRRAPRGRPVLRPLAARRARTGSTTSPRSSGSSATTRSRRPSRRRGRADGGRPTPIPIPRRSSGRSCSRAERRRSPGRLVERGPVAAGDRHATGTDRRSARAAACPGAPAASRTGSRATSGRTRRRVRPSRPRPSWSRSSILGRAGRDPAPRGRRAGRDRRRPPGRRGARRDLVVGQRRDPEPHAPPVRHGPRAARARRAVEVRVPLRHAGYRFEPGHAIRVSVASSAWPVIWPSPVPGDVLAPPRRRDPIAAGAAGHPGGGWSIRSAGAAVQDERRPTCARSVVAVRPTSRSGGSRRT